MDILQEIIKMDKAASANTEAMREAELNRLDASDTETTRRFENAVANEQAQAEAFRKQRQEQLSQKKADTQAELGKSIDRLNDIFSAHKEEWQTEIISRITGV